MVRPPVITIILLAEWRLMLVGAFHSRVRNARSFQETYET
jgi:hypothetical protein